MERLLKMTLKAWQTNNLSTWPSVILGVAGSPQTIEREDALFCSRLWRQPSRRPQVMQPLEPQ